MCRRGFSLVEVLLALLLLTVGILGGLGSIALAWRTARTGDQLAAAAGRAPLVLDSLRARLLDAGSCGAISAGQDSSPDAVVNWKVASAAGGLSLTLTAGPPRGLARDTGWTFLPCNP